MKRNVIFYSRMVLFMLGFTGVYLEITKHGGLGMLMYYTVLSNMIVTAFTAYLLYLMARSEHRWQTQSLFRLKGGVTMCIMITCVIYHFMLAPLATDFYRLENFLCHYIVPLWFLADTLLFDKRSQYRWFDPIVWTSVPLIYLAFALFNAGRSMPARIAMIAMTISNSIKVNLHVTVVFMKTPSPSCCFSYDAAWQTALRRCRRASTP